MTYSKELHDELKKLLEKTTPLPWINMKDDTFYGQIRSNNEESFTEIARMPKYDDRENDFDLIESAVNNLSDLLDEIDRLQSALTTAQDENERYRKALNKITTTFFGDGGDSETAMRMLTVAQSALNGGKNG